MKWWPFKPKKPMVYVGTVEFHTKLTDNDGKIAKVVKHYAVLTMSEDNRREVKYSTSSDYSMGEHSYKAVIEAWKNGGKFPTAGFDPEDCLGEMLNRMIDARLTGKK